jgi:hypothetical protein
MKKEVKRSVNVRLVAVVVAAPILGLLGFGVSHLRCMNVDLPQGHYPFLSLIAACFGLWMTSTFWLAVANLLILFIASPFMIWPQIRPAAIRAWIISVLAFLCARFILFYAGCA